MPSSAKVVSCPLCGHQMAIPPQFANTAGSCRVCGGVVNAQPAPNAAVAASSLGNTRAAAAQDDVQKAGPQAALILFIHMLKYAVPVSAAGSALLGLLCGLTYYVSEAGALWSGLVFGITLGGPYGFIFGAAWGFIVKKDPAIHMAAAVGALIGLVVVIIDFYVQAVLLTPSDYSLLQTGFVGASAGALFAIIAAYYRSDDD
ncbi:MAG: hypothetical protein KJ052_09455 [Candidatus Hydrogenedentes bacterium]|nr:hypothetical protein [Candidatus Hydrogenedentota bacterium]